MRRFATACGLSLLYASAYFLPFLTPYSLYFIPSFIDFIVLPSLVTILFLTPVILLASHARVAPRVKYFLAAAAATLLTLIAIKSMFDAGGYPWIKLLSLFPAPASGHTLYGPRSGRVLLVGAALACAVLLVLRMRRRLPSLLGFLSTLGYAFLFLAIYRCYSADLFFMAQDQTGPNAGVAQAGAPPAPRRVIWLIFDELDYALSLGAQADAAPVLQHFARLARQGISATEANTPSRDTLASIPALLTGTPLTGVALKAGNQLILRDEKGRQSPFNAASSLFSRLPGGAQSASVTGFYHPYCKVLPQLQSCHSTYLGNAGRWFDSLLFFSEALFSALRQFHWSVRNMPEPLLFHFDPMYRVSINTLGRLDATLGKRHNALDFIHLNVPHLPNVHTQRLLGQRSVNEHQAYLNNLVGADQLLGRIMAALEAQPDGQQVLLMVSSDHWLRTRSQKSASVPFIAWTVGATDGQSLARPFSTVHSATLALDFLNGKLTSQADLLAQMSQTTFHPTWIPPDDYKY